MATEQPQPHPPVAEAASFSIEAAVDSYDAAHREKRRASNTAYNAAHREERRAWQAAHREERRVYGKAYREAHRETRRVYQAAYNRAYRKGLRAILIEAKSRPCMDCGASYPYYVMDFDHVRGTKAFNISRTVGQSPESLRAEIAKCDLVCSNCHRLRTHQGLAA